MTAGKLSRRVLLLAPLALTACGTGGTSSGDFPLLSYTYLPALKLNVASIDIENQWQPAEAADHVESLSPETPLAALREMAKDRLAAYGTSGKAVFVIEDASLIRGETDIHGSFAVRLDVYSQGGTKAGSAEARVSRDAPSPGGQGRLMRQALYDLTRTLMNSMNVEFEYQVRRSLGAWLQPNSAAPTPIEQQPLAAPGAANAAPPPAAASAPGVAAPQPGVLGTLPVTPAPTKLSP